MASEGRREMSRRESADEKWPKNHHKFQLLF